MLCLILLVLFFSRRYYWHDYGYHPNAYGSYGAGYGYGYGGGYPYTYGAYSYYNPYSPYNRMFGGRYGYYRPYGYW